MAVYAERGNRVKLKSWSPTKLPTYEECAYRIKLRDIDKIPEPERPLPEGKLEHANDRGTRIHGEIEAFIRGDTKIVPKEAEQWFGGEIRSLREYYKQGTVFLEEEWGFNDSWEVCDYKNAWLRMKCDWVWFPVPEHCVIGDWKSGRKFNNEAKHAQQMGIYAIAGAIRNPLVDTIDTKLLYIDQKPESFGKNYSNLTEESKPVSKWLYQLKGYHNRAMKMMNDETFKPNPNANSCKWCPYREGLCEFAYTGTPPPPRRKKA